MLTRRRFRRTIPPNRHFHASWCGITWYYQGSHFKAFSVNQSANWAYYLDGPTGHILARQQAPKDFHCNLRFEDSGPVIDIVNDDGGTREVLNQIYTELKAWAGVGAGRGAEVPFRRRQLTRHGGIPAELSEVSHTLGACR